MTTLLMPCMGGWCAKREHCANYHQGSPDHEPAERICETGHDGHSPWAIVIPLQTAPVSAQPGEHHVE